MNNQLYGLGTIPKGRLKPYAERFDFAEEIGFLVDNMVKTIGQRIDSGQYDVAATDLRFFRGNALARLRVASKYGLIHRRDFLPLAKDVVNRITDLSDEIRHARKNIIPLILD